jgi:hypothetical protein
MCSIACFLIYLCLFLFPAGSQVHRAMSYPQSFIADALGIVNDDTAAFLLVWIIGIALDGILLVVCALLLWHVFEKFRGTQT